MKIDFTQVSSSEDLDHLLSSIRMQHADRSYWKQQENEAIMQEFDGQQGFLYQIDIHLTVPKAIPLTIDQGDLHILYVLSSGGTVLLLDATASPVTTISSARGRYLYLPTAAYSLVIPIGKTQLFGFYFRGRLFRQGNERPYDFLQPLIHAYRNQSPTAYCSIDFKVGPRTRWQIEMICRDLKAHQLHNESFIYTKIVQLIKLSLEKVHEEQSKTQYELRIANNARHLLTLYIEDEGQYVSLQKLESDLHLDLATINRYHKLYFGSTLSSLRKEILLHQAKEYLRSGLTATQTAYSLNYSHLEGFLRFFKRYYPGGVKEFLAEDSSD